MGVSLIGMLVEGPKEIGNLERKRREFDNHLQAMKKAVLELQADPDIEVPDWFHPEFDPEYEADTVLDADASDVWDRMISLWEGRQIPADCACRPSPFNHKRQIMFCGEMSWGDSPEGEGYQILWKAERLGLLEILGIK